MKNISEYDERQFRLMHENLISFEKKQIELSSLVSALEFLLNVLEAVNENWEEKFLKEIATLETVNALTIVGDSGEKVAEIEKNKRELLINKAIQNLKEIINSRLNE